MSQEKQTAEEILKNNIKNKSVYISIRQEECVLSAMEEYATLKLQEQAKEIERLNGERTNYLLGFHYVAKSIVWR